MRSLRTATKSSPRLLQLEEARTQQRRPNAAKNKTNKINKFIFKKNWWSGEGKMAISKCILIPAYLRDIGDSVQTTVIKWIS